MEDTIFAKILRREIFSNIVYEDGDTLAFLDTHPNNPGHTLVIPKAYARNIFDISDESFRTVMHTVHKIAPAIRTAVGADGMTITMNNEPSSGQDVFHAHVHLIPRFTDDGYKHWPRKEYANGEAEAIATKIHDALN